MLELVPRKMAVLVVGVMILRLAIAFGWASGASGSELWIGASTADITPGGTLPLTGGRTVRISQGIRSRCTANALALEARHGEKICVLGFCAPAGDQAPNLLFRKKSESRMDRLRGVDRTQELGRRIAAAFDDVLSLIEKEVHAEVPFTHRVERFDVPGRKVTDAEYARARGLYDPLAKKEKLVGPDYWNMNFYKLTIDRYEAQQTADPLYTVEMHVLRLGDTVIATNPFELFLDYGVQIEARSPAKQTILIQLASPLDFGYCVPTARAIKGGGYSAIVEQSLVGPAGGQALVERTLDTIGQVWEK